jgi:MerR family transcriptional regulator, light-induced transcriptional regulator
MRRLIIAGMSPAEAAEKALSTKSAIKMEKIVGAFSDRPDVIEALHSAANALDKNFIESTLRNDIEKYGVIRSWQEVIVPVLVMLGKSWEETGVGIEIEHFFSETLKRILRERSSMIQKPINPTTCVGRISWRRDALTCNTRIDRSACRTKYRVPFSWSPHTICST